MDTNADTERDRLVTLMQPWAWIIGALALTGVAFVWARFSGSDRVPLDVVQVPLIGLGVVAAGLGVWLRAAVSGTVGVDSLSAVWRRRVLYVMALILGAAALAITAWVFLKFSARNELPGDRFGTIVLWMLAVPWLVYSTRQLVLRAGDGAALETRFETALLATQASVASLLGLGTLLGAGIYW